MHVERDAFKAELRHVEGRGTSGYSSSNPSPML